MEEVYSREPGPHDQHIEGLGLGVVAIRVYFVWNADLSGIVCPVRSGCYVADITPHYGIFS
jgi:hypothetical protein